MKHCATILLLCLLGVAFPALSQSAGHWEVTRTKSPVDDSPTVFVERQSDDRHVGRWSHKSGHLSLMLQCREGQTAVGIRFAGNFMATGNGHGAVTTRVDERPAEERGWDVSTDHEWMMLMDGDAITFIRSLQGAKSLFVRATPYSESMVSGRFTLAGLDKHVGELAKACKSSERARAEAVREVAEAGAERCAEERGMAHSDALEKTVRLAAGLATFGATEILRNSACEQRARAATEAAQRQIGSWKTTTERRR